MVMKLSEAELQEFIEIYREDTGETLSITEASEMTFRLIHLYTQLSKALPSEQRRASSRKASLLD